MDEFDLLGRSPEAFAEHDAKLLLIKIINGLLNFNGGRSYELKARFDATGLSEPFGEDSPIEPPLNDEARHPLTIGSPFTYAFWQIATYLDSYLFGDPENRMEIKEFIPYAFDILHNCSEMCKVNLERAKKNLVLHFTFWNDVNKLTKTHLFYSQEVAAWEAIQGAILFSIYFLILRGVDFEKSAIKLSLLNQLEPVSSSDFFKKHILKEDFSFQVFTPFIEEISEVIEEVWSGWEVYRQMYTLDDVENAMAKFEKIVERGKKKENEYWRSFTALTNIVHNSIYDLISPEIVKTFSYFLYQISGGSDYLCRI